MNAEQADRGIELLHSAGAWCGDCDFETSRNCQGCQHVLKGYLAVLQPLIDELKSVDREALARAAHHYFCTNRLAADHTPIGSDYDKADEILKILALVGGAK